MKKRIAILLITIIALGAAACQKTPESPIVIGKDYETMIEQAILMINAIDGSIIDLARGY